jgi:hypothetical protein
MPIWSLSLITVTVLGLAVYATYRHHPVLSTGLLFALALFHIA